MLVTLHVGNLKVIDITLEMQTILKELKSANMNIFQKKYFLFKSFLKVELSYVFTINLFTKAETARKSELSYKIGVCILLLVIICVTPIIIDINI